MSVSRGTGIPAGVFSEPQTRAWLRVAESVSFSDLYFVGSALAALQIPVLPDRATGWNAAPSWSGGISGSECGAASAQPTKYIQKSSRFRYELARRRHRIAQVNRILALNFPITQSVPYPMTLGSFLAYVRP
jgi:hypothetical protein